MYNDVTTAQDNIDALLYFFIRYNEYSNNDFWIAGESYAGKFIPDLAVLIDEYNLLKAGK
jgi:carboxypeptidase C (cathepsin A)